MALQLTPLRIPSLTTDYSAETNAAAGLAKTLAGLPGEWRKQQQAETQRLALLGIGQDIQSGNYQGAAAKAFGLGDIQGGATFLGLGQKAQAQKQEADWLKSNGGLLGSPVPSDVSGGAAASAPRMPPAEVKAIIDRTVPEADREYAYRMADKESRFDPNAVSPTGAKGLFQFTGGTGRQYGLVDRAGDLRANPEANTQAFVRFTEDNRNALRKGLGREPTYGELALAHQQGAGGALALITGKGDVNPNNLRVNNADPSAPRSQTAQRIMAYYGYGNAGGAPAQAAAASAQPQMPAPAQVASVPGDDPIKLRQDAQAYAQTNPEAARQMLARADAAERAAGVQTAQAGGATSDMPAPGAAEAQFVIPGTTPQQTQGIMQDRVVQNLLRAYDTAPEKFKPSVKQRLDLRIEELKQARGEETRAIDTELKREKLAKARRDNASTAAPTTKVIKQADGSEVAVQWDADNRRWIPLTAPEGGNAVRPAGTKLTEGQSKDLVYHTRGLQALEAFEPVAGAYASGPERAIVQLPGGNYAVSEEFQMARQAGRNFLASILRKDTGAAITAQEEQQYGEVFLPTPGDKPGTIAQKAEARKQAIDAIRGGLGTAEVLAIGQRLVKRGPGDAAPAQPSGQEQPKPGTPKAVATPQDYQALKPGDTYTDPQGNVRTKR